MLSAAGFFQLREEERVKQTILILSVALALVLAFSGVMISANLHQSEVIAGKTSLYNELLGKLSHLSQERLALAEQAETLRDRLHQMTKDQEALALELDATAQTIQAANDAILHGQRQREQEQAEHSLALEELNARLEASLQDNESLMGERNSATLRSRELLAKTQTQEAALSALTKEVDAFSLLLRKLESLSREGLGGRTGELPVAFQDPTLAKNELLHAWYAYMQAFPNSALRLPQGLIDVLKTPDKRQDPQNALSVIKTPETAFSTAPALDEQP